ncbi:MAG TPA: peptidase M23 [Flavobacteriales bacterium]|nr:peptidase M23 [Flavobacteriales bacterium]
MLKRNHIGKLLNHNLRLTTGIVVCILSLFLIGYISDHDVPLEGKVSHEDIVEQHIEVVDTVPLNYFVANGIVADSLLLYEGIIKKNQNLSEILLKFNISYALIAQLANKSKEVFEVRKFVVGKKYNVFYSNDTLQKAISFIYEIDAANYVVYNMLDSIRIYRERKEVDTEIMMASGEITSSLWQTMADNNINFNITVALSEIYAWAIDFYRIQKGDYFKVLYEEKFVDGESVGIGKVIAAYFNHYNHDYYAVYFEQGEAADYFDENANSLRKAFLKAPLKYSRISSRYSMKRFHPVQKRYKAHLGTDYAAPRGTPIMSTGDGVIQKSGYSKGNGNYVKVRHNSVYSTQYLHMNKIKSGIRKGVRVRQGDVIGYVGSTGLATGPHVCYRFWKNGRQVDALKVSVPPSLPVEKKYRSEYEKVRDEMIQKLRGLDVEV